MIGAVLEEAELSESVTVKEGMVTLTPEVKESLFTVKLANPEKVTEVDISKVQPENLAPMNSGLVVSGRLSSK